FIRRSLDIDVDTCRKIDAHESVNGLRGWVESVDEALVGAHLEVLARVLVLVWRTNNGVYVLLGRSWHRADNTSTRAGYRLNDLLCRSVDCLVVVGLQPNADFLSRHAYPLPRFPTFTFPAYPGREAVGNCFSMFSITL